MEPIERTTFKQGWLMKNRATVMLIVVSLYALFMTKTCMHERSENKNLIEAIKLESQKVTYWKDATGKEHAKVTQIQLSHEQMNALHKGRLDSMAKLLGIKQKQITQLITIGTSTKGKINSPIDTTFDEELVITPSPNDSTKHDTVIKRVPTYLIKPYNDKWLTFEGFMRKGMFYADYTLRDSLTLITSYKNRGLLGLGRRDFYIDIAADNPNTTITNAKGYKLDGIKERKIGFGFMGGYGISLGLGPPKISPFIGAGIFYKVF